MSTARERVEAAVKRAEAAPRPAVGEEPDDWHAYAAVKAGDVVEVGGHVQAADHTEVTAALVKGAATVAPHVTVHQRADQLRVLLDKAG